MAFVSTGSLDKFELIQEVLLRWIKNNPKYD